jgi:uncharacterized protein YlxW (UPF0749 family)
MNEQKFEDRDGTIEKKHQVSVGFFLMVLFLFACFLGWLIYDSKMKEAKREIDRDNYELSKTVQEYRDKQQRAEKARDEIIAKCNDIDGVPLFTFGWRIVCIKTDAVHFMSAPLDLDPL